MQARIGVEQVIAFAILAIAAAFYATGWRRLRRVHAGLASPPRLLAFGVGLAALTLALVWPLPGWSNYLLAARSLQKALICMVGVPLIWVAAPVHAIVWGQRRWAGRWLARLHRPDSRYGRVVRGLTQPLVVWFLYVATFLFWHDAQFAAYLLGDTWGHTLAPWGLLLAALLFWGPVVDTGPRLHRALPVWLLIVYLITVEIANMVAGMTIAFSQTPLYPHYTVVRAALIGQTLPLSPLFDQIAGGAIVWVFGSLVYISGVIFILHRLFRREGVNRPLPAPNWDDHAKLIAPGLEHRVAQNKLHNVDLSHR
jgi:cytochrome c oxidase assembly factor CtaG